MESCKEKKVHINDSKIKKIELDTSKGELSYKFKIGVGTKLCSKDILQIRQYLGFRTRYATSRCTWTKIGTCHKYICGK